MICEKNSTLIDNFFDNLKFEIYTITKKPDINSDRPKKINDNGGVE